MVCCRSSDAWAWRPGRWCPDDATGVGRRNADGTVTQTRLFSLFSAHYGCRDQVSATRMRATRRAASRTRSGSCDGDLMVPEPSAEGWDAPARAWLDECDAIARREHYRQAAPIRDLFETDLDHMLPLPGTPFDACDWRSVKTDRTGTALIDGNRYLAGPRWRSMRLRAGVRALDIEMRGPDGEYIVTLERVWGHEPRTVMEPATLLAIIARKPRMWGESPIRGDFPENVRDLLDRMDGRARADLVDDIRHVSSTSGFAAAAKAVSAIIDAGRRLDRASIDQTARRIRQGGEDTAPGPDLSRYNTYMEERDDD